MKLRRNDLGVGGHFILSETKLDVLLLIEWLEPWPVLAKTAAIHITMIFEDYDY